MSLFSPLSGIASPTGGSSRAFTPVVFNASYELLTSNCFSDLAGSTPSTYGTEVARVEGTTVLLSETSSERPVLSTQPSTGRRNRIRYSNSFTDSAWVGVNANLTAVSDGFRLQDSGAGGTNAIIVRQIYTAVPGVNSFSLEAKQDQLDQIVLRPFAYDTSDSSFFSLSEGTVLSEGASHTATVSNLANGWKRVSVGFTTTSDVTGLLYIYLAANENTVLDLDGTSSVLIRNAQAEEGAQTGYQTTLSEYESYEEGFVNVDSLSFDGIDDRLSNSSFDVGSSSWTLALSTGSTSNLAIQFESANIYTASDTVSAQVSGVFTPPQSHAGISIVAHSSNLTSISSDALVYSDYSTSAYANAASSLTLSGGGELFYAALADYKVDAPELQVLRDSLTAARGDVQ